MVSGGFFLCAWLRTFLPHDAHLGQPSRQHPIARRIEWMKIPDTLLLSLEIHDKLGIRAGYGYFSHGTIPRSVLA